MGSVRCLRLASVGEFMFGRAGLSGSKPGTFVQGSGYPEPRPWQVDENGEEVPPVRAFAFPALARAFFRPDLGIEVWVFAWF